MVKRSHSHQRDSSTPALELSLREHLLQEQAPQAPSPPQDDAEASSAPADHSIDPDISAATIPMSTGSSGGDEQGGGEAKKGRRELANTKRAAQNRAAQRAFRQRKETYIKSLKDQVKEYDNLAESYKAVQSENYQLRDYIINLQSRLLESQGEYPDPPDNLELEHPRDGNPKPAAPEPNAKVITMTSLTMTGDGITPEVVDELQQAAAQATAQEVEQQLRNGSSNTPVTNA